MTKEEQIEKIKSYLCINYGRCEGCNRKEICHIEERAEARYEEGFRFAPIPELPELPEIPDVPIMKGSNDD